jgi:DNA-binding SARP family transcriptional activator/tetratricopeptide (TPR) repeat protein
MEFRLLGPVGVWDAGRPVRVGGRRERTMLAVLLLAGGRLVPVEKMIDAVWGDVPPPTARRQVHSGVSELRRVLGPRLVTREPGYLLAVEPDAVDLEAFESMAQTARRAAAQGRPEEAAAGFRAALRLWLGPALSGVSGLAGEAARLEERRLAVLAERIDADLAGGRHADLTGELAGLVAEHPLRERFAAQLMLALYRCGRQPEALRVYRDARRALSGGLGLEPGGELRRLERAVLAGDPRLDPPAPTPAAPCLLPADVRDFTGRDAEVALLCAALGAREPEAVAVSGRGGVGKTALAVRVAHRLRPDFPHGQLYVNLYSGQTEPGEVLGRFLRALGVDGTAIPADLDERAELYRVRLAGRKVLVLLDNAGDEAQVTPLLPGGAGNAVLVTGRSRLGGLPGARRIELDVLDPEEALRLLGTIVGEHRVAAEPAAAADLVRLCGRLPLAVRIAGARLAARPHWLLADLVARLSDERHRLDELSYGGLAVRASLEISVRGLDADARRLFRRLGLLDAPDFAGWVGAALLGTPVSGAADLAERLVDARLLEVVGRDACGEVRFRFHDLVRAYARERAEREERPAARRAALARAFGAWLAGAERAHRAVYGGDFAIVHGSAARCPVVGEPADPLAWLETERLGIVASVAQAAGLGLAELAWDLAGSCVAFFAIRWYLEDWRRTAEWALEATRRTGNRRGEAATLYALGAWLDARGSYEEATSHLVKALRTFEELGDRHGCAVVLVEMSHLDRRLGRFDAALESGERGRALAHEVGDRAAESSAVRSMAQTRHALGRYDLAERGLAAALSILDGTDSRRDRAQVLYSMGELHFGRGALDAALEAYGQVLDIVGELRDRAGEAHARHGVGACHLRLGDQASAEAELGRSLAIAREAGLRFMQARVLSDLGGLRCAQGRPAEADSLLCQALELWRALKAPLWEGRTLRSLGDVRRARGDDDGAARAWAGAEALFAELGAPGSAQ